MDDVWSHFMEHMVVRVTGPMKFRLLLQRLWHFRLRLLQVQPSPLLQRVACRCLATKDLMLWSLSPLPLPLLQRWFRLLPLPRFSHRRRLLPRLHSHRT